LQDGSVGLEELLDTGFLVDLRKGGRGGDAELIKMAMLLLLGLWGQLADVQIENSIEFVGGKGRIHAFDLVLPVVEHRNSVGKFFHDFHDDCLGLVYINGWSFFGLGSEFHLQNQGVGLSGHWSVGRKIASGHGDIVIIGCSDGDCFLGTVGREEGHVNVHG
jgi:hypothetical protein